MAKQSGDGDLLTRVPYFAGLDAATLNWLGRAMRRRRYEPGEQILLEGAACEGLYVVIEGQVRLMRASPQGREQVLGVLGAGATFNDVAVFDAGPNADSAVAVGPTVVGLVPRAVVTELLDKHPEVARAALKLLSARQRSLAGMVEDLALRDVTQRVARLLLGCVGRQPHMIEKADAACAHITHQEIAAMVGSVREVVQRALKSLEVDGAIKLERSRVHVRDVGKLERWAGAEPGS
jgi:CRP/FNR family transcriptional regulator